ncbi:iron uptake regulator [Pseudomonas cichorii]|uniref:FecR domain-containing protein n=1 Tax=Pseudomonas cichorii TaxID=36746 RepID=UPI00190FD572|nr:FecR domain-containing protein [Pseudomonas cichorii]GFM87643.1 iron uptake regulator [Pseudomonas cichorii]
MSQQIDPQILGEAADWMVQLQSGVATEEDHRAVQNWRNRSPQHAQAWQRAEAILGDFRTLPAAIATETFKRVSHNKGIGRRQALTRLGILLLAGPTAWLAWQNTPWRQWTADHHTAIGEQKNLTLSDGTRVLLNTASSMNIAFSAHERRIQLLTGEILITTAKDSASSSRPFYVQTEQGTAQALGTRFSVRIDGERSLVAVQEGSVHMQPNAGQSLVIKAGEQSAFSRTTVMPVAPLAAGTLTWENGMLLAQDMRLADLLDELGRYRSGVLRCHAAVADLRVSGAFPLRDTDASLRLLHDSLPITVSSLTRYWVAVEPR